MAWLQTLHHLLNPAKIERVAAAIAAEQNQSVWQHVAEQGIGLSRGEARGYVRARAARIVRNAVDVYLQDQNVRSSHIRSQLIEQTTLSIIKNVVPQLSQAARSVRQAA